MNYLVIVNKDNLIEDSYLENLDLVDCIDAENNKVKLERTTYNAYLKLKEFLESMNIYVEIDSAFRTIEYQQEIIDDYTNKYGSEYVKTHVAPVRTSEHHTGLAIDLSLVIDGKVCIDPDELLPHEDIFLEIHKYLSKYGFILRYPKGKEEITGYSYEPWHIRYVGNDRADYIYKNNLTLEEYVSNN